MFRTLLGVATLAVLLLAVPRERAVHAILEPIVSEPVAAIAGRELPRLHGSVEPGHPDRAAVLVRVLVDPPHLIGDARAVGRDARVGDAGELVDVLRAHPGHRAGL